MRWPLLSAVHGALVHRAGHHNHLFVGHGLAVEIDDPGDAAHRLQTLRQLRKAAYSSRCEGE